MKKRTPKKAKQVRDTKSRYTRFTIRRARLTRLADLIHYYDTIESKSLEDVTAIQEELRRQIRLAESETKKFYDAVKYLHDDMKIYVAELRYQDGDSWQTIADKTGLHVQTLYNYDKEIRQVFTEHGLQAIIKHIEKSTATQYIEQ